MRKPFCMFWQPAEGNAAMTVRPRPSDGERSTLRVLSAATLAVIDELTAGDLLAAVTPERLGAQTGYAPSSIRYQLSRLRRDAEATTDAHVSGAGTGSKRWAFDREHLLLVALEALAIRQQEAAQRSAELYLVALRELARTGEMTALGLAIQANLDAFTPGATENENISATERAWAVAVAAADGSVEVARRLRRAQADQVAEYHPVYELALEITGRTPRAGIDVGDIAQQINLFLEGVATRRRFEPALDESKILGSVLALFVGMTYSGDAADAPDAAAQLAADVRRQP
jgi:ribosomal protein L28/DNA-binding transcriptional ArsR family regulator